MIRGEILVETPKFAASLPSIADLPAKQVIKLMDAESNPNQQFTILLEVLSSILPFKQYEHFENLPFADAMKFVETWMQESLDPA